MTKSKLTLVRLNNLWNALSKASDMAARLSEKEPDGTEACQLGVLVGNRLDEMMVEIGMLLAESEVVRLPREQGKVSS